MLLDAEDEYSLSSKIFKFLPDYSFNLTVHANRAVRMKNLKEKFLNGKYTKENPDGFIIMAGTSFLSFRLSVFLLYVCMSVRLFLPVSSRNAVLGIPFYITPIDLPV